MTPIYRTLVIDSVTFMELAARKWDQFVLNPRTEEPRQWYAASTELLEQMLMMRLRGIPANVIVLCHVDHDKDEMHGTFLRMPMAPGKLRGKLASAYSEYYRAYVDKAGRYLLQTRSDSVWSATTRINAPNPCPPTWHDIWSGWEGEPYPIHVLVYGDAGAGKSTFAASAPKPMLVMHFDPFGKETPYLIRGKPSPLYGDERHDTVRSVHSHKTGKEIIRIEYFHDREFTEPVLTQTKSRVRVSDMHPDAYHRFLKRMTTVQQELDPDYHVRAAHARRAD